MKTLQSYFIDSKSLGLNKMTQLPLIVKSIYKVAALFKSNV